jgi:hypothetical protein
MTDKFDQKRQLLNAINAAVYDAVANVAQYAALSRAYYSKAGNPQGWRAFLGCPSAQTPNEWERR